MCGIVGVAGSIYKQEKDVFENLLIYSQVRGPHSTGVASVSRTNNEVIICKAVGRPDMLIDYDKRYDRAVDFGKKFILGHNRYATTGKVNKKNCHPFLFENIVGCHNGTVFDHELRSLKIGPTDYDTDSECLLANINEHPMKDVFDNLNGAWALVWYDSRDNTLNIYRNSQRELFYAYSADRKAVFWASEVGFLESALTRNHVSFKEIHKVSEDKHLIWVLPDISKELPAPRQIEVKKKPYVYKNWGNREGRFPDSRKGLVVGRGTHDTDDGVLSVDVLTNGKKGFIGAGEILRLRHDIQKMPTVKDFAKINEFKNLDGQGYLHGKKNRLFYRGFRGEQLSKEEFEATAGSCGWCDTPATWGQPIRFLNKNEHICLECNNDPEVVNVVGAAKA